MDDENGCGVELPPEIIERVLSFLPVPVLCRFRSVCKGWNEMLSKPSFHDLREVNGRNESYLFAVRSLLHIQNDYEYLDPIFLQTMCFFDVHEKRWYSIKTHDDFNPDSEFAPSTYFGAFAGMGNGLICEVMKSVPDRAQIRSLILTDPVAELRREILVPPMPFFPGDPAHFPVVVTAWHRVASGLQIFLLNNGLGTDETQMYVYDPCTSEWRDLGIPPRELGVRKAVSAVIFQGILYVVFYSHNYTLCHESYSPLCVLVSYNLEKGTWREMPVSLPTRVGTTVRWFYPLNLIVSGDRLFLMMWGHGESGSEYRFHPFFAMIEILVMSNSSKVVIQIPTSCSRYQDPASLRHYFAGLFAFGYGVPCIDSEGICSSVLWVTDASGEVAMYDMESGAMTDLPPHPLRNIDGREMREIRLLYNHHPLNLYVQYKYRWKFMTLNWRKLLSRGVAISAQDVTT